MFNVFVFEVEFQHINVAHNHFLISSCRFARVRVCTVFFGPCTLFSRTGAGREIQQKITHSDILSYSWQADFYEKAYTPEI